MLSEALATGGTVLIALGACVVAFAVVVILVGLFDRRRIVRPRGKYPRRW
jgi:hypothetical protein